MSRYEKYKPSEIEWINEIPEHWDFRKFKFLFALSRGLSITKENLQDEGVPCVNYGEIHSRLGIELNPAKDFLRCVSKEYIELFPNSLLKKGDFVFADTSEDIEGSGNFTLLNSDILTFAGYHTIIAKPLLKFSSKYLAYYFDSLNYRNQIRSVVNGIKVFSITQSILKNTVALLPSPKEQTAIATYLDEKIAQIDNLISSKQQIVKLLKEERTIIIDELIIEQGKNWKHKRLKYLAKMQGGFAFKSDDFIKEGIQLIKIGNLYQNEFTLERQPTFLPEDFLEKYPDWVVSDGDILMSMTGTLGKRDYGYAIQVPKLSKKYLLNQRVSKINFNESEILKEFGLRVLLSTQYLDQLFLLPTGTKQGNFSNEQVLSIAIKYPNTIKEQEFILSQIKKIEHKFDDTVQRINTEIELIKEYKTALISEVVTGKQKVYN
jgi:type I restriction enzyme S subunit